MRARLDRHHRAPSVVPRGRARVERGASSGADARTVREGRATDAGSTVTHRAEERCVAVDDARGGDGGGERVEGRPRRRPKRRARREGLLVSGVLLERSARGGEDGGV